MTRSELEEEIYQRLPPYFKVRMPKTHISLVIDNMFDIILEKMLIGVPVRIYKYGTFDPKIIRGKRTREYKTGKIKDVKPYLKVAFKLSRGWKLISKKVVK